MDNTEAKAKVKRNDGKRGIIAVQEVFMRLSALLALTALAVPAAALAADAPPATAELKVGDLAPDFKLQASDGKTYRLSDFKGKKAVVLAWFPKAFTSG